MGEVMGMDVYGNAPTAKSGEYFRNNCWWWRPLWNYCHDVAPDLISAELHQSGHCNDGAGLDADGAKALASKLRGEISSNRTEIYAKRYSGELEALPDQDCIHCHGTGKRNDAFVKGQCNGCEGTGRVRPSKTHYPFDTENVEKFAEFLESCGGFKIC